MIVGYRVRNRAVFLLGFAKNERENIEDDELLTLRSQAERWLVADAARIQKELDWVTYRRSIMTKKANRVVEAILEMADDQLRSGLIDNPEHEKITIRHMGSRGLGLSMPIKGDEIRNLRLQAHMSQAAFARVLNLTVGYVSQLERGIRKPAGPALSLLNVIRRKGVAAILGEDAVGSEQGIAA